MIKFIIPIAPVTKKNSQQIRRNFKTGKPFIAQSDAYRAYEDACGWFLKPLGITCQINIKALYYLAKPRRTDITNLHSALHDVLVKHGVIADDNYNIVVSTDGSRVYVDKANPRTEVEITEAKT